MMASKLLKTTEPFVPVIDDREIKQICEVDKGTFGTVYKAVWRDEYVAVKYIKQEQNEFTPEVNQLARVEHPNVICLYGYYIRKPNLCLVMEFAEGGSLFNLLHCSPQIKYTFSHAMSWAKQCAEGIDHLHAIKPRPLIHRDLKTMNLLLVQYGTVLKICDFGTATELKSLMTTSIGTMAYMAPEVFKGAEYTEKCDVYSWGIILWEVFSRQKPFHELHTEYAIMYTVGKGKRPPLTDTYPKLIKKLIMTCWDQSATNRPIMSDVVKQMVELCKSFSGGKIPLVIHNTFVEEIDHREIDKFSFLGMYGKVYKAVWRNLYVAVKYIKQRVPVTQISHHNIVDLYGVCSQGPNVCLIMEFCEGFSLFDVFYSNPQIKYTLGHAMSWMKQLAEVREFLYSTIPHPIIQKMFYKKNILLVNNGTVLKVKINDTFTNGRFMSTQQSIRDVVFWGNLLNFLVNQNPLLDNISLLQYIKLTFKPTNKILNLISICCAYDLANQPTMLDVVEEMKDLCKSYPGGDKPIFLPYPLDQEINHRQINQIRLVGEGTFGAAYNTTWKQQCTVYRCIKQEQNPFNIEFRPMSWFFQSNPWKIYLAPIIDRANYIPEIFEEFIHFLNTNDCKITDDNGIELLKLAIKYKVVELENKVLNSLSSVTWVLKLFEFCVMEKYQMARKFYDELIAYNYDKCLKDPYFLCLHPDAVNAFSDFDCVTSGVKEVDVFNAIANWIHAYCAANRISLFEGRKHFDGLVKKIRFSTMETIDFNRCLKIFPVQFNENEVGNAIPRKHFENPYAWRSLINVKDFITELRVLDYIILCGLRIGVKKNSRKQNFKILIIKKCVSTAEEEHLIIKPSAYNCNRCVIITLGDSLRLKPGFSYNIWIKHEDDDDEKMEVFCRKLGIPVIINIQNRNLVKLGDLLSGNMLEIMFVNP